MLLIAAAVLEALAGVRVFARMAASRGGTPLAAASRGGTPLAAARDIRGGAIDVIVPVLNEEHRVPAALRALAACGPEVGAIVVVDGGSRDATRAVVDAAARNDARVRFVDAPPTPPGWNNKAWNLRTGIGETRAPWIATVDADVSVGPRVLADALARAEAERCAVLSVATRQALPDGMSALLHPALLTTLVYRRGMPNVVATVPARAQANGQLMLLRRDAVERSDAIARVRASRCEDVTIARVLAASGERVGFFEGDAVARMHASWRDCAASWPRSLTLRDTFVSPARLAVELAEVALAQALPLPALIALAVARPRSRAVRAARGVALALVIARVAVLCGTRRAYVAPSPLYWLSPLADVPVLLLLTASALRRRHVWRGRALVAEHVA